MYLKRVLVKNIRSLTDLAWQIEDKQAAGWHVILGDNGAGKSTFVRSVALALIGPGGSQKLTENWADWLAPTADTGRIELNLLYDEKIDKVRTPEKEEEDRVSATLTTMAQMHENMVQIVQDRVYKFPSATLLLKRLESGSVELGWEQARGKYDPYYSVWGKQTGWFSAAYGPSRRLTGGDTRYDNLLAASPEMARYLSVFDERVALTESLRWLKDLQFKKLEGKPEGAFLDHLKTFINQPRFLAHDARLADVTSDDVRFVDGNGVNVAIENLSDGYRSVLSLTFDLLRQLQMSYGSENVFDPDDPMKVSTSGVTLIDEVDAHLHPTWQRRIGPWFRRHFPNMQFIVTTHSPLVCQAAEHGTVYRLPTPGTSEQGHMLEGTELNRLLYGNILDAYSTGAFGYDVGRSEEGQALLRQLAALNVKELADGLTEEEEQRQDELRGILPTSAYTIEARNGKAANGTAANGKAKRKAAAK